MRRVCMMCKERPAKKIEAGRRRREVDGIFRRFTYTNAYKGAIFCTLRCATNWALCFVERDWCDLHREWYGIYDGCHECSRKEAD